MTDLLDTRAWPDPAFEAYSRSSRHRLDLDDADAAMAAEIQQELALRPIAHDALIRKGLIASDQAAREIAILRAIAADIANAHDAAAGVSWRDKIAFLRAEILHRRATWPRDIGKGLMQRADAIARLEAIEGLHDQYWTWGWWLEGGIAAARQLDALQREHQPALAA